MIRVTEARYLNKYKLYLYFNNNRSGIVDLEKTLQQDHRAIFKQLLDLKQFKQFTVAADTIVWENGLDLAPEFLYEQIEDKK